MTPPAPLRVLLVEDHRGMRSLFRAFLESAEATTVAGEAGTGPEAVQHAEELRPDVVVMDMQLPTAGGQLDVNAGIEATRDIVARCPDTGVLVTTGLEQGVEKLSLVMAAGARGFVTKYADPDVVLAAIQGVARGELWVIVPGEYAPGVRNMIARSVPGTSVLTPREQEVLGCFCTGMDDRQIAERLGISRNTVANHFTTIQAKLDVPNRVTLLRKAQAQGWFE